MVYVMKKFKILLISLFFMFAFSTSCFAYNEAPVDITNMDIYEIQDAIDDGYLTYETLVKLYLDRINVYDKTYNAIITVNKNAVKEARKCDEIYKKNGRSSDLFCIPIIVKDNIDVKGMPTTVGTKALSDSYPKKDAKVIELLRKKGMIVLAKTNMSEFALKADSSESSYGIVRNAYNKDYSSYGSSGGSAVGVALGYAPVGIGTDTNSSLRVPAAANNVVGFRSTFDLIDNTGVVAYDITRDVVGTITKTVRENALVLEGIANKRIGTYSKINNKTLKNKKILVLDQFAYGDESIKSSATGETNKEIQKLFNKALNKMKKDGAKIIHINNFYSKDYQKLTNKTLGGWTMCSSFNDYIKNTSSKIKSFKDLVSSKKTFYNLSDYVSDCSRSLSELDEKQSLKENLDEYVRSIIKKYDADVIVYPTVKNKLLKLDDDKEFYSPSYTIAPMLGYPAISIPLGFDSDNLPYGIEFVTVKNKEKRLYNITSRFEKINNISRANKNAPSLYTVHDEVENLKLLYEENKNRKDLSPKEQKLINEMKDFFINYNNYDDKSKTAEGFYKKYQKLLKKSLSRDAVNYDTNYKSYSLYTAISIGIGLLVVVAVVMFKRFKRNTLVEKIDETEEEIEIL